MSKSKNKKGVLSNTLYDVENTYSLDFETTGTGRNSRIWSIGMTGGKESSFNKEFFIADVLRYIDPISYDTQGNHIERTLQEQLLEAHKQTGADFFGKRQMEAGSFKPFEDALLAKRGSTVTDAITQLSDQLKKDPGILLIQNASFENGRLLSASYGNPEIGTAISKDVLNNFVTDVLGRDISAIENRGNILNVSDDIFKARREFNSVLENFKLGNNTLEDLVSSKNNLRNVIDTEIKDKISRGFSVPIELMDLTAMLQVDMAEKGLIQGNTVGHGRGMEVLAEYLLGTHETHMALDDTHKQVDVYRAFKDITKNLQNGVVPDSLTNYIEAIDKNKGNVHDIAFLKNIRNRVEETLKKEGQLKESSLDDILQKAVTHYVTAAETNVDRGLVAYKLKDTFLQAEDKSKVTSVLDLIDDFQDKIPKLNSGDLLIPTEKPLISKALSSNAKIAIGAGAVGAIGLISLVSNKDEKPVKTTTAYNDLYNDVRLGSAYADWKERNNSHNMIY